MMTLYDVGIVVSLVVGALTLISAIIYSTIRMAKIELKVDTMWTFQLRRGFGEALEGGLLERNSPIKLTEKAKNAFNQMRDELQRYYTRQGVRMTDGELALAIERQFGQRLIDDICIPLGVKDAACLILAVATAKGIDTLEVMNTQTSSNIVPHELEHTNYSNGV